MTWNELTYLFQNLYHYLCLVFPPVIFLKFKFLFIRRTCLLFLMIWFSHFVCHILLYKTLFAFTNVHDICIYKIRNIYIYIHIYIYIYICRYIVYNCSYLQNSLENGQKIKTSWESQLFTNLPCHIHCSNYIFIWRKDIFKQLRLYFYSKRVNSNKITQINDKNAIKL